MSRRRPQTRRKRKREEFEKEGEVEGREGEVEGKGEVDVGSLAVAAPHRPWPLDPDLTAICFSFLSFREHHRSLTAVSKGWAEVLTLEAAWESSLSIGQQASLPPAGTWTVGPMLEYLDLPSSYPPEKMPQLDLALQSLNLRKLAIVRVTLSVWQSLHPRTQNHIL